jgi:hypothetical protein
MKEKDIKILWGRSGNRCAMCKMELTPDGSCETLGEIAHIVARSLDGPRGTSATQIAERDAYSNLILLCPNHHAEVDKSPDVWPVARLEAIKRDHEIWVSERLQAGQITISPVDNSAFLETQHRVWAARADGQVAVVACISPLRASMEVIDPLAADIVTLMNAAQIPTGDGSSGVREVNRNNTRPSATGLLNEDLRNDHEHCGHSIHAFRVGHCEYFCDLSVGVRETTEVTREKNPALGATKVIRYTDVAEAVALGLGWLWRVWNAALPFSYMTVTVDLLNTSNSLLYSREDSWKQGVFGFDPKAANVEYTDIVHRDSAVPDVTLRALQRIAHSYGLLLDSVHDAFGQFLRPRLMK